MFEKNPLTNSLLAVIPPAEWNLLEPHATIVTLRQAQTIFAVDEPSDVIYFPLSCIVSMIAEMANGDQCEYGCIGREGMLGLQVALSAQPLRGTALCQLEGAAVRLDGGALRTLAESGNVPRLQRLLLRYAQGTINVLAQSAACNALHSVYQRTARWLLLSRDRAGSDYFSLTQDFLAKMLGVRRASVTNAAARLERERIIEYDRGNIHVRNGEALEAAACECYWYMRNEFALVLENAPSDARSAHGFYRSEKRT